MLREFIEYAKSHQTTYLCIRCWGHPDGYAVEDSVWYEAFPDYDEMKKEISHLKMDHSPMILCCLPCLETLLNRPLVMEDFKDVSVNKAILWAWDKGMGQVFNSVFREKGV